MDSTGRGVLHAPRHRRDQSAHTSAGFQVSNRYTHVGTFPRSVSCTHLLARFLCSLFKGRLCCNMCELLKLPPSAPLHLRAEMCPALREHVQTPSYQGARQNNLAEQPWREGHGQQGEEECYNRAARARTRKSLGNKNLLRTKQ